MSKLKLSLVTTNRNDSYMGNSNYRLEVSINYLAEQLAYLDKLDDVEYIIVDWGSKQPLHSVLNLSDNAKKITRFILVPVSLAEKIKAKSDFPAAMAFNIGIRRSRGDLVTISPADTIFPAKLLDKVLSPGHNSKNKINSDESLFVFARKNIPMEIVNRKFNVNELTEFIDKNNELLVIKNVNPYLFSGTGVLIMRRSLWFECHAFDEKILHWGWNDIDLCLRVRLRYPVKNMSKEWDSYVYHLDHYPVGFNHEKIAQPVLNQFAVNTERWGFLDHGFEEFPSKPSSDLFSDISKPQTADLHFRRKHWLNLFKFLLFSPVHLTAALYALKMIFIADSGNSWILSKSYHGFKMFKNKINTILRRPLENETN
ncbi:MAG: hypothetical protein NTW18_00725 [Candidatus Omnitrophica bacterium]|nr:hypothetical protein [Candidatus Omnitrophota bacterium]